MRAIAGFLGAMAWCWIGATSLIAGSERINHEGRILGPLPVMTSPTLFNSAAADAVVAAMQILPVDNAWNEDISRRPLLGNSAAMIAQIKSDLSASRQTLRPFYEMNYVLVPDNQARVTIPFFNYPDESDLDGGTSPNGSYPIPTNLPVEGWPRATGNLTLTQWQQDVNNTGGDRHAIMVAPGAGSIWETWLTRLSGSGWQASNGAKFDLTSNNLRPATWTSGDAAGLPMFPAIVRYDECERGMVEHALRLVVAKSRKEFIYPARHYASSIPATSINYPAMGQRLRLKASFTIPANWTIEEKAVLLALKKYGAMVADNGGFFSVSVCPDDRFPENAFDHLSTVGIDNFEVIQTTGPSEGPRSPGAPSVDAGPDLFIGIDEVANLNAIISAPSGGVTLRWRQYAGPAAVNISNPSNANTNVSFTQAGSYLLEVSASDGVHAVAYDAVTIAVMPRARLANISTRAAVGRGDNVTIAGFIINGATTRRLLIRAIGPSLADRGVADSIADPVLELHDNSGNLIATNDNWKDSQQAEIEATGIPPGNDAESALVWDFPAGAYSAVMSGKSGSTGVGLVEVFELGGSGTPRLLNISTRGFVGSDDNVLIAGLIITGSENATICFRALGPSLTGAGVPGALADPYLQLFNSQGVKLAGNDNWQDTQRNEIQQTGLAPVSNLEAALLVGIPPGAYSAIVSGVGGATGIALVEAYHLP